MTVVASAPSGNGSWWRNRGFLLIAAALLVSGTIGVVAPNVLNREPAYPLTSAAIAFAAMITAAGAAAGARVMQRRRR